jgi:prepilin-type N-terminal cleavage/methylation domain-containing protein/prepilin-type processing-associated H-X9-DG protein
MKHRLPTPRPPAAAFAFTLIELLVVISILSVLVSLVVPSLKASRETAKSMLCANNQKQVALGLFQYSNDWKAAFPFVRNLQRDGWPSWNTLLGPYLGNTTRYTNGVWPNVMQCPSRPFDKSYWQAGNPTPTNYAYGTYFNWYPSSDNDSPIYIPSVPTGVLQNTQPPRRTDRLRRPNLLLLTGEVPHAAANSGQPPAWAGINIMVININNAFFPPSGNSYWFADSLAIGWWNSAIMMPHPNATWNSLYADGHVVPETRAQINAKPAGIWTDTW